eukprot:scaffold60445_cov44-Phaeocystis_antarctica.AAC.1
MRARCARGAAGTPQGSPARKQDQPRRSGQAQTQSRPCPPSRRPGRRPRLSWSGRTHGCRRWQCCDAAAEEVPWFGYTAPCNRE